MSTSSIIAIPTGDTWKGRYCHSDGYPTAMARQLRTLVARDGLDTVRTTLTQQHAGWSLLDNQRQDLTGVQTDPDADYGTYEWGTVEATAWEFQHSRGDGRFANIPGYGVAYTSDLINNEQYRNYRQVDPDDWATMDDTGVDAYWAYVLGDRDLLVYSLDKRWTLVGRVTYDVDVDVDDQLRILECGERYERCSHVAQFHFPEAPRIGTSVWLGRVEPGLHDIKTLEHTATGKRVEIGGSSGTGSATDPVGWRDRDFWNNPRTVRYYWVSIADAGPRDYIRIGRILKGGGIKLDSHWNGIVSTSSGDKVIAAGTTIRN